MADCQKSQNLCAKKVPPTGRKTYPISKDVASALMSAKALSPNDYEVFCMETVKDARLSDEALVRIKNLVIQEQRRAWAGRRGQPSTVEPSQNNPTAVVATTTSNEVGSGSGELRTVHPRPGINPPLLGLPVTQTPLIVRSDLAAMSKVLALDTEKIISSAHEPLAGDLSIVDLRGRVIFWGFIKHEEETVCRMNEQKTGLNSKKLNMGLPMEEVRKILDIILAGKTVVGFALINDFKSIGYKKTTLPTGLKLLDLQDFYKGPNNQPIGLSYLGTHFLGVNHQISTHSSLKDARVTAICYKRMQAMTASGVNRYQCDAFDELRSSMKKQEKESSGNDYWEPCRCGLSKKDESTAMNPAEMSNKKKKKKKKKRPGFKLYCFDDPEESEFEDGFYF